MVAENAPRAADLSCRFRSAPRYRRVCRVTLFFFDRWRRHSMGLLPIRSARGRCLFSDPAASGPLLPISSGRRAKPGPEDRPRRVPGDPLWPRDCRLRRRLSVPPSRTPPRGEGSAYSLFLYAVKETRRDTQWRVSGVRIDIRTDWLSPLPSLSMGLHIRLRAGGVAQAVAPVSPERRLRNCSALVAGSYDRCVLR